MVKLGSAATVTITKQQQGTLGPTLVSKILDVVEDFLD